MGDVINIKEDEFKHCIYTDHGDFTGLSTPDWSMYIAPIGLDNFSFNGRAFTREELAEFLHVALVLIDSEDRYKPDIDMVKLKYE